MSTEEIEKRIPHRPPMRLVDAIIEQDDSSIVCSKTFQSDEYFVQGHFPDRPIVPGVIQCECCLQAGAVLLFDLLEKKGDFVPVATRMDGVKFKRMVRPGDTVEIRVQLNDRVSDAFYMTGKLFVDGKIACRLDFACSVQPAT